MTFKRLRSIAGNLVLLAALAFGALMIVPAMFGYERYVITTGSMAGTYDPGSLIYDKVVPSDELRVGDVITYAPPDGQGPAAAGSGHLVTHRIASIEKDGSGRVFRTKGDANATPDPWTFRLADSSQAKVVASVPYVGHVYAKLTDPDLRKMLFAVPGAVIALLVITSFWREAGSADKRRQPSATASEVSA